MHRTLKLAGALLLLASLALPMSSCSYYVDANSNRVEVAKGTPPPEGVRQVVTYDYALDVSGLPRRPRLPADDEHRLLNEPVNHGGLGQPPAPAWVVGAP